MTNESDLNTNNKKIIAPDENFNPEAPRNNSNADEVLSRIQKET